ncbi:MAG: penicillin-binding protein 1B, partial [Gammaproteobacteria bacterium]
MAKRKPTKRKKRASKKKPVARKSFLGKLFSLSLKLVVVAVVIMAVYLSYLDVTIRSQFEGKKWSLPARVYARPLELYVGAPYSRDQVKAELKLLGYRYSKDLSKPGTYQASKYKISLHKRAFEFWDGAESERRLTVSFGQKGVTGISARDGKSADLIRFDPLEIGGIYP